MSGVSLRYWMVTALVALAASRVVAFVPKPGPNLPREGIPTSLPARLSELIDTLYEKDPFVRAEAALTLGEMGSDAVAAIPYLVSMLDDDRGLTDIKRLNLLFSRIEERYPLAEPPGVYSKGLFVGDQAAIALARIGPPAVEALIGALRNTQRDGFVINKHWGNAAWALGRIGDRRAVGPLCEFLSPLHGADLSDLRVSIHRGGCSAEDPIPAATVALGKLEDERAIPALVAVMSSHDGKDGEVCRAFAAEALAAITGESFGINVDAWIEWSKAHLTEP